MMNKELLKICKKLNLPQKEENITDRHWGKISQYHYLSEDFMEKYQNKIDWWDIAKHQKLSINFIRKYKSILPWEFISIFQELSMDFLEEFKNYLSKKRSNPPNDK